jgi:hypothetical protein
MLDLMKLYGPIDWRLPDALSLYWAARGIEVFGWEVDKVANTDRILFHALTNLFRRGRLRFVSAQGDEPLSASIWDTAPHFAFLKRVVELQESIVKRYKGTAQEDPTRDGFMNFLREVVLSLYIHGDQKSAATYFKMLQGYGPEQNLTLDEFIRRRYEEEVKTLNYEQTCNLIQAHFFDCFWWVSLGDVDQANAAEARARALAKAYEAQDRRLRLPPLRSLRKNALREAIRSLKRFQVDRLREVYPDEVKEIEKESEKPAPPRQGQPAPPRAS